MFFVIDGGLHTPCRLFRWTASRAAQSLSWPRKKGIQVIERHIKPEELKTYRSCS